MSDEEYAELHAELIDELDSYLEMVAVTTDLIAELESSHEVAQD